MKDKIIALHGEKTMRISAVRSEAGPGVFRKMLAGKGYRTILEIGTYRGCAAAEMAQYCDKVITIDLKFGAIERRGGKFDRVAFWRSLGVNNIELHLVDNDVEKVALVNGLDFDFAFVDGGTMPIQYGLTSLWSSAAGMFCFTITPRPASNRIGFMSSSTHCPGNRSRSWKFLLCGLPNERVARRGKIVLRALLGTAQQSRSDEGIREIRPRRVPAFIRP